MIIKMAVIMMELAAFKLRHRIVDRMQHKSAFIFSEITLKALLR